MGVLDCAQTEAFLKAMAVAMTQHRDDFLDTFKKDLDIFVKKLGHNKSNPKKTRDPALIHSFDKIAESMAGSISKRFGEYAMAYDLDKVALETEAGHLSLLRHHEPAEGQPSSPAVAHLEAELQRRSEEEVRLRSELMDRIDTDSGPALHECNPEFLQAQQAASDHTLEPEATSTKGARLRWEQESNEALLSALASLTATLDEERENNRRIENQLSQPLHPVEANLRAPLGQVFRGNSAEWQEMGEETQELAAALEQSKKDSGHMQSRLGGQL